MTEAELKESRVSEFVQALDNLTLKSHPYRDIVLAYMDGEEICVLDTDTYGGDDVLIGPHDEVLADVLAHHELDSLPPNWSLERLDPRR